MTTETQPSAAAMRAAKCCTRWLGSDPPPRSVVKDWNRIAAIIDRETGLADLLFAAQEILIDLESGYIANSAAQAERRRAKHEERIRAAIAKAKP